ncbi:MAG: COX15/CtaA family protein [Bacteroidetes bacterium]|nr:COX15/CtaA family protein [Bacteroidota bacterium]
MISEDKQNSIVAKWLLIGVGMLIVQVLLGGITRLTGSGLSITEWDPIMGAIPPLNHSQWEKAFDGYQQIAQYKYLNNHFTLSDFKFIFFWEWFHRLWARLMGLVFLFPFIYFLWKGYFKKWMILPLIMLFVLGGLQGLIGWIMVSTGLNDQNLYVTHFSLAIHFIAAMILTGYTLIFALSIIIPSRQRVRNGSLKKFAFIILALLTLQLIYGSFMAGLKAAVTAPTWPSINGSFIPSGIFTKDFIKNALHNPIAIQLIHRTLAYIIFILVILWWVKARKVKISSAFNKAKNWLLVLVLSQVLLGILTVVNSTSIVAGKFGVFELLAELHQLTGMLLLLCLLSVLYILKFSRE